MATIEVAVRPRRHARPRLTRLIRVGSVVLPVVVVLGYFGISAYVADRLTRPARNLPDHQPSYLGLAYEDVVFNSAEDNIPLGGWYIDSPGDRVVIMMHGRDFSRTANGGLEKAAVLAGHGYAVLMFDFRAHGLSGGDRYTFGQRETRDVEGALTYLRSRGVTSVAAYGISMGAATALMSAAEHPEIKAVMAESSYAELSTLIEDHLPRESGLPRFFDPGVLLMARLVAGLDVKQARPVDAVRQLGSRPILLVHSANDEFVPLDAAYRLLRAGTGNPNLSLWELAGASHCEGFTTHKQEYTTRMLAFYDTYFK